MSSADIQEFIAATVTVDISVESQWERNNDMAQDLIIIPKSFTILTTAVVDC